MEENKVHRVLFYATTAYMIDQFNMMNISMLQDMGYDVDVACNFEFGNPMSAERLADFQEELTQIGVRKYQLPLTRNILDVFHNGSALIRSVKLMRKRRYDFVHCHTPVGAVIARLACMATGTKVIYTAHGFHFFDGAPKQNWLIYYPVEKLFARFTDVLITINREDHHRARTKFHMKRLEYVPGIGIDLSKYRQTDAENMDARKSFRDTLGIGEDTFLMLSVGELSKRKNHIAVLEALTELKEEAYHYIIVGTGVLKDELQTYIDANDLQDKVTLLGYRTDVDKICRAADAFVFPSLQEGLPAALMEAMACGLPAAVSRIRGNADLITAEGGILFSVDAHSEGAKVVDAIRSMMHMSAEERFRMGQHNAARIQKEFSQDVVREHLKKIYMSM